MLFSSQQDHDTQRLYRLYDFSKSQIIHPDGFCCVAGKVNSADKLYLVIESVKRDTQPWPAAPGPAGFQRSRSRRTRRRPTSYETLISFVPPANHTSLFFFRMPIRHLPVRPTPHPGVFLNRWLWFPS